MKLGLPYEFRYCYDKKKSFDKSQPILENEFHKKYDEFILSYDKQYSKCPKCRAKIRKPFCRTSVNVNKLSDFKELNKVSCKCGWKGEIYKLI